MHLTRKVLALVTAGALLASAATAAEARTLNFATPAPPTERRANDVLRWWAGEVESRTNGSIEIKIHWLQSLVKYKDAAKGVSSGLADIAPMSPEYTQSILPLWTLSATSVGPGNQYVATEAWSRIRDSSEAVRDEEARNNMHYIAHYSGGGPPVWVSNTRPYIAPADFQGDKVRMSAHAARAAQLEDWPVTQVSLPFTDAYSAMERGTVDGTQFYLQYMIPYKLHEVAKHIVEPGVGQQTAVIMMNRRVWESLTDSEQKVFDDLSKEFSLRLARSSIEDIAEARETLENSSERSIDFYRLDETQKQVWEEGLRGAQQEAVEKSVKRANAAAEIHQRYMEELRKVEQEFQNDGYPWEKNQ